MALPVGLGGHGSPRTTPTGGGDPAVFAAGLTRFDADQAAGRVSVCRSPSPTVRGRRMLRRLRRRSGPQHGRVV